MSVGYQNPGPPGSTSCSDWVAKMTLKTLNPTCTNSTATNGTTAPRVPNWARDCTIRGSPIRGPWLAWNAMKKAPNTVRRTTAEIEQAFDWVAASPGQGWGEAASRVAQCSAASKMTPGFRV